MYNAHLYGKMVIRPLFFSYPTDEAAMEFDNQFMWGDSIMFAPIITEVTDNSIKIYLQKKLFFVLRYYSFQKTDTRLAYFPSGFWYSIRSNDYGQLFAGSVKGMMRRVHAPKDWNTPVYLLGTIILSDLRHKDDINNCCEEKIITYSIERELFYIEGGKIVPTQIPSKTTNETRKNPFGLIIALGRYCF